MAFHYEWAAHRSLLSLADALKKDIGISFHDAHCCQRHIQYSSAVYYRNSLASGVSMCFCIIHLVLSQSLCPPMSEQSCAIMDLLLLQNVLGCLDLSAWSLSPFRLLLATELAMGLSVCFAECVFCSGMCVFALGQAVGWNVSTSGNSKTDRCVPTISLQLHWHFNDTSSSVH